MKKLLILLLLIPSLSWGNIPNCQTPFEYISCDDDKCFWKIITEDELLDKFESNKNFVLEFINETKKDKRNFTDDEISIYFLETFFDIMHKGIDEGDSDRYQSFLSEECERNDKLIINKKIRNSRSCGKYIYSGVEEITNKMNISIYSEETYDLTLFETPRFYCQLNNIEECLELGFKKGTEGLKNCVLELN